MEAKLAAIYYYPVKGLPGVPLQHCKLRSQERLPADRCYAVAPQTVQFDSRNPRHVRKQELFALMKHERLAELQLKFRPRDHWLTLSHHGQVKVDGSLQSAEGRAALENTVAALLGEQSKLLSAPGHGFTDLSHSSVSLINLASVRDLETSLRTSIDMRRFRANLYIDGVPPWTELDWLEKSLHINNVELEVYRVTDRCGAINVDPDTARRDRLLQNLRSIRGNLDMGVYVRVINNGEISVGDSLQLQAIHP